MRICRSIGRFSTDTFYRSGLSFHFQIFVGDRQTNSLYLGRTRSGTRGLSSSPRRPPSLPPTGREDGTADGRGQAGREGESREGGRIGSFCCLCKIDDTAAAAAILFVPRLRKESAGSKGERERERCEKDKAFLPSFLLPSSFLPSSSFPALSSPPPLLNREGGY